MADRQINLRVNIAIQQSQTALKILQDRLDLLNKRLQAGGLSDAAIKKINSEIRSTTQSVNNLTRSMNTLTSTSQKTGNMWMNITRYFTAFLAVQQVTRAIRDVAENYVEFSKILATNRALMRGTTEDLNALRDSALELSKTSKFTAIEIANLQTNLIKLGVNSVGSIDILTKSIMNLAAASDEDLAKSGDVLYSLLNQFGLDASYATEAVNIMTDTMVKSASDLESYANSMKYVGSSAHQLGLDLRETSALIATISNLNIKGSSAGTAMNNLLMEMAKNSSNLNKAFGVQIKGFGDVIKVLEQLQGMETADIMGIMNIRSTKAALPYKDPAILQQLKDMAIQLEETGNAAEEYGYQVYKALGTDPFNKASNMAKTAMDSVSGDLKKLTANATALGLELLNSVDSPIRKIVQGFNDAVDSVRNFTSMLQNNWSTIQPILKGIVFYLEAIATLWATSKMTAYFKSMADGFLLFQKSVMTNYKAMILMRNANVANAVSLNVLDKGLIMVRATMKSLAMTNPLGLMLVAALAIEKIFKNLPANVERTRIEQEKMAVNDKFKEGVIKPAAKSAENIPVVKSEALQMIERLNQTKGATTISPELKKGAEEAKVKIVNEINAIKDQIDVTRDLVQEQNILYSPEYKKMQEDRLSLINKVNNGELKWTDTLANSNMTALDSLKLMNAELEKSDSLRKNLVMQAPDYGKKTTKEIIDVGIPEYFWGKRGQPGTQFNIGEVTKKEIPKTYPGGSKDVILNQKKYLKELEDLLKLFNKAEEDAGLRLRDTRETNNLSMDEINRQARLKELEHLSKMAEIRLAGKKDEKAYVEDVKNTKNAELEYRKGLIKKSILSEDEKNAELYKIYEGQVQVESTYALNRNKMYDMILSDQEKYLKESDKNLQIQGENTQKSLENEKQLIDSLSYQGYIGQFEIEKKEIFLQQKELVANAEQTYMELENEQKRNSISMIKEARERQVEMDKIAYDEAAERLGYDEEKIKNDKTYKDTLIANQKSFDTEFKAINDQANEEITRGKIAMNEQILNGQKLLHDKQLANEREFIKSYNDTMMDWDNMLADMAVQANPKSRKAKIAQSRQNEESQIKDVNDKYKQAELDYGPSVAFEMGLWAKKEKAITAIKRKGMLDRIGINLAESQQEIQIFQDMISQISGLVAEQKAIEQQEIDSRYEQQIQQAEDTQNMLLKQYDLKNKEESQMTGAQIRKLNKINKQAEEAKAEAEKKKEEDSLKLKKKYAEKEFALKVMTIIGNTAMAISDIWSKWAAVPPVAIAMSAVAGAIGAVQVAQAKKQKDAVQNLEVGGIVRGPSHKQGGVPVELEGDEIVINKKSASIPWVRQLALQLNSVNNSKASYGRVMANGGVVISTPQQQTFDRQTIRDIVEETTAGVVNTLQVINNPLEANKVSDGVKKVINQTTW